MIALRCLLRTGISAPHSFTRCSSQSASVADGGVFASSSTEWWNEFGDMKALHSMNRLRVPWISSCVASSSAAILDVGCGAGILCEPLARLGYDVTGVDESANAIKAANEHRRFDPVLAAAENLAYVHDSIESIGAFHSNRFDAVVASEVVEHVDDKAAFLEHALKCLRPGGSLFLTTINRTALSRALAIEVAERTGLVPAGAHDFDLFISPDELQSLVELHDRASVVMTHGLAYNPFSNRWSWSAFTPISYAMRAVKL